MFGKVRGRDVVVLVVALVMMFRHADKLTLQKGLLPRGGPNIFGRKEGRGYSSRPGRDMSSRIASLGLLLWWSMASICSVIGISTA
jgi:hypothetical protein